MGGRVVAITSLVLVILFVILNIIDAVIGRRPILSQFQLVRALTAPLNAAVHLGTPPWLKKNLNQSGILTPTPQLFPNLLRLREAFPIIEREALAAIAASKPIKNDLYFHGIADDGWKRFYIKWYGPIDPQARQLCPLTSALLESMPEVHLGMFSILMPGSYIPPHFGPTRMCLRYHLGIFTPNDDACSIRVGEDYYSWRDGEDIMFDDTIVHEVSNTSSRARVILFLDIERPQVPGIFSAVTKAMIKHGGPLTTRSNDTQEKVLEIPKMRT